MPKFETGVLTMFKSKVNGKKRVKNGRPDFWDDFEIFRKFREHFCRKFKRAVLTNNMASFFKRAV